ncbi:MAG: hypothetical protein PHX72_00975 [Candidatus Shapirobacteria bacterium]|nr:hypothetical protein [Candidatus Shapirobacteria bacterium]
MTSDINRQLGIYSTQKKKQSKQTIKKLIIVTFVVLAGLVGQQAFLKIKNQSNQTINPQSENSKEIITQIAKEKRLSIEIIEEKPDMIRLLLETGVEVFLDKKKALDAQLNALQLIINQDKINGRKPKKIDLRFNNPIVTY